VSPREDVWLSQRLGKPAYRAGHVPESLPHGPAFIDAKVDASDTTQLLQFQAAGFCVIDVNVQLVRNAGPLPPPAGSSRFAGREDEAGVRAIAADAFVFDRFHRDPEIGHKAASRIKADWAGNFFTGGRGEWMVVAGPPGKPEGFLQLMRGAGDEIIIDLVATAVTARGKGHARNMIVFAATNCLSAPTHLRVGTQIANAPSLALYESLGFRVASAAYVLHLHR
jgi:ribosomal protein S18 acetylase RimI-like enzyme